MEITKDIFLEVTKLGITFGIAFGTGFLLVLGFVRFIINMFTKEIIFTKIEKYIRNQHYCARCGQPKEENCYLCWKCWREYKKLS